MEKEFEALEILYNCAKLNRDRIEKGGVVTYAEEIEYNEGIKPHYATLKQALTELQAIKEAKPSKAIMELEVIKDILNEFIKNDLIDKSFNTIKQALIKAQEQEKVLEILFGTKNIEVGFYDNGNGRTYYIKFDRTRTQKIKQEEFELLKRWALIWK